MLEEVVMVSSEDHVGERTQALVAAPTRAAVATSCAQVRARRRTVRHSRTELGNDPKEQTHSRARGKFRMRCQLLDHVRRVRVTPAVYPQLLSGGPSLRDALEH